MASLTVERRIAADPTSTALLLAGPTALDLWPGARREGEVDGRLRVAAALPATDEAPTEVLVRALPPRRTPVSFVTRFAWAGSTSVPDAEGVLTLRYDGALATRAELTLRTGGAAGAEDDLEPLGVRALAGGFLANLAAAAEARATAA